MFQKTTYISEDNYVLQVINKYYKFPYTKLKSPAVKFTCIK